MKILKGLKLNTARELCALEHEHELKDAETELRAMEATLVPCADSYTDAQCTSTIYT